jgi:hypothetical protein
MTGFRRRLPTAIAAAFLALAFFGAAAPASAATGAVQTAPSGDIKIETPIPSALENGVNAAASDTVKGVTDYIRRIYTFAISIVGMVAAAMMIIGGFQYLTSAGDAGKIGAAKKRITDALIGLVLALGSYALLRSLNPDLVSFKPLTLGSAGQVKTELQLLPWCEDLIAKGLALTQLTKGTKCGDAASYMNGDTELPCIYHGECAATLDPRNERYGGSAYFDGMWNTCLQTVGLFDEEKNDAYTALTPDLILKIAKKSKDQEGFFGICTTCAEINAAFAKGVGYKSLGAACDAWNSTINAQFKQKYGNGSQFWSYCAEAGDNIDGEDDPHSCIQADIDCQQADNNEDTGPGDCSDNENDCGCEGYDDQPTPHYARQVDPTYGNVTQVGASDNALDSVSAYHLGQVCNWNPCLSYTNTVNNKQNFAKGCNFKADLTRHITTDWGIDCRNR